MFLRFKTVILNLISRNGVELDADAFLTGLQTEDLRFTYFANDFKTSLEWVEERAEELAEAVDESKLLRIDNQSDAQIGDQIAKEMKLRSALYKAVR